MPTVTEPHLEVNEDGKAQNHPGYVEMKCQVCGRVNMCHRPVAVRDMKNTCVGRHREEGCGL